MKIDEILLIDDDPVINLIHNKLIEKALPGYKTCVFTNPEDGLVYLRKHLKAGWHPLIILDINMPEMNAWEFIDRMQSLRQAASIPIAIVTSSIDQQDQQRAEE
ncbi:MAG: response regulator, partial [Cyclobacteriaceae bacterium]